MYLFFWVSSIGGVLTLLSYLYGWSPEWEVLWTCLGLSVQPCEKLLCYINCCSGYSNYCHDLRVSVTLWQTFADKRSWNSLGMSLVHLLGRKNGLIDRRSMAVHAKVTGQPHQWGQKVAWWEASLPLPSHLPVTGSVPNLPLSSAPFFSVVGVWHVCKNLALLASTNFTGGEGDARFQRWTKILFAWKMSGATRNEWRKLTAGFSLAVWAGRGWEMESWPCRYCFFFWGSSSVKATSAFLLQRGKWGAVSEEERRPISIVLSFQLRGS